MVLELGAVTVPPSFLNAGGIARNFSSFRG